MMGSNLDGHTRAFIITWLVLLVVPGVAIPLLQATPPALPLASEKLVMANLYTWYGHPDGGFGEYIYRNWHRLGEKLDDWDAGTSTMQGIETSLNGTLGVFNASATCVNASTATLALNSTVPGFNTGAGVKSDRKYFKINAMP